MRNDVGRTAKAVVISPLAFMLLLGTAAPGCYLAHELPVDADLPVDLGFPTQTVVVLRQNPPHASEPAVGAQVVVEDCETGVRYEAFTDEDGVATVGWGDGTCWNVTAVLGDEARSVLGGPVPLPGPIVMPYETNSETTVGWGVDFPDYTGGGYIHVDVPGTLVSYGTRGITQQDVVLRDPLATVILRLDTPGTYSALVPLSALPDGTMVAEVRLPLPATRSHSAELVVRPPSRWPASWQQETRLGTVPFQQTVARRTAPSGTPFAVGLPVNVPGPTRMPPFRIDLFWTEIAGTEEWSPPSAFGLDGPVRWRDACSPILTWGDVVIERNGSEFDIPPVDAYDISGDSLETLRVRFGGPGHRTRMVLRTPPSSPFEWTIEPFELGAVELVGVPALPSGVAERVGFSSTSVYVQVGIASPIASYDAVEESGPVLPWWLREGFVFGAASDFDDVVESCPVRGPR